MQKSTIITTGKKQNFLPFSADPNFLYTIYTPS